MREINNKKQKDKPTIPELLGQINKRSEPRKNAAGLDVQPKIVDEYNARWIIKGQAKNGKNSFHGSNWENSVKVKPPMKFRKFFDLIIHKLKLDEKSFLEAFNSQDQETEIDKLLLKKQSSIFQALCNGQTITKTVLFTITDNTVNKVLENLDENLKQKIELFLNRLKYTKLIETNLETELSKYPDQKDLIMQHITKTDEILYLQKLTEDDVTKYFKVLYSKFEEKPELKEQFSTFEFFYDYFEYFFLKYHCMPESLQSHSFNEMYDLNNWNEVLKYSPNARRTQEFLAYKKQPSWSEKEKGNYYHFDLPEGKEFFLPLINLKENKNEDIKFTLIQEKKDFNIQDKDFNTQGIDWEEIKKWKDKFEKSEKNVSEWEKLKNERKNGLTILNGAPRDDFKEERHRIGIQEIKMTDNNVYEAKFCYRSGLDFLLTNSLDYCKGTRIDEPIFKNEIFLENGLRFKGDSKVLTNELAITGLIISRDDIGDTYVWVTTRSEFSASNPLGACTTVSGACGDNDFNDSWYLEVKFESKKEAEKILKDILNEYKFKDQEVNKKIENIFYEYKIGTTLNGPLNKFAGKVTSNERYDKEDKEGGFFICLNHLGTIGIGKEDKHVKYFKQELEKLKDDKVKIYFYGDFNGTPDPRITFIRELREETKLRLYSSKIFGRDFNLEDIHLNLLALQIYEQQPLLTGACYLDEKGHAELFRQKRCFYDNQGHLLKYNKVGDKIVKSWDMKEQGKLFPLKLDEDGIEKLAYLITDCLWSPIALAALYEGLRGIKDAYKDNDKMLFDMCNENIVKKLAEFEKDMLPSLIKDE